jgi:phosphoribosylanthranilate isomerase
MKIKICGMMQSENILETLELKPDFMGFIFYEKSPRYCEGIIDKKLLSRLPKSISKVGVFVNETIEEVLRIMPEYNLDFAQIHGDETPDYCKELKAKNIKVIKAFAVDSHFDFDKLNSYEPFCDFFLFDTKTIQYGGSGQRFDWNILKQYNNEKPFFLSGGISPENFEEAARLTNLNIEAIDLNSKFEKGAGLKDVELLRSTLFPALRQAQ